MGCKALLRVGSEGIAAGALPCRGTKLYAGGCPDTAAVFSP